MSVSCAIVKIGAAVTKGHRSAVYTMLGALDRNDKEGHGNSCRDSHHYPLIMIINLPEILVSIRMAEVLAPDKTKPYSKQVEELENTEKSLRGL